MVKHFPEENGKFPLLFFKNRKREKKENIPRDTTAQLKDRPQPNHRTAARI